MEQMAKDFAGKAHFPFMYVREAHPGSRTKPHSSMRDKIARAKQTQADYGDHREIVVDNLEELTFVHKARIELFLTISDLIKVIPELGRSGVILTFAGLPE